MSERPVRIEHTGGWGRASTPWHPALRPYLTGYVGYWEDEPAYSRVRLVANGQAVVIISLGEPFEEVRLPHSAARLGSLVAGLEDGPGGYAHPGGQLGIQIDLTPLGAYRLFGLPMHDLANSAVDLADVLGPAAGRLIERLRETPGWADRFDLLDALLLARLETGPRPAPEVTEAWRLLTAGAGRIAVADVAAAVGWSNKHLISRFKEQVGLPPKAVARILRFQRAMAMLQHGVPGFVDIALACGYYDQAHLNREFRALAGATPTQLLAAQRPGGDLSA